MELTGEYSVNVLLKKIGEFRLNCLLYLAALFLLCSLAVRMIFQIAFPTVLPFSANMLPGLLRGLVNDAAGLVYVLLIPAALILLPTNRFLQRRIGRAYIISLIFIYAAIFIFTGFAEFFFWDEFGSRFNFIAVDYLIYTTEVMQNMIESYPMGWLLLTVGLIALGVTILLWRRLRKLPPNQSQGSFTARFGVLGGLCASAALLFQFFTPLSGDQNRFWNEYAKNGTYELFSAYLVNQLDYRAFYKTIENQEAYSLIVNEVKDIEDSLTPANYSIVRNVSVDKEEVRPNVIVILMESMGSRWLGEYTPNLNQLAKESLTFTNMVSTGMLARDQRITPAQAKKFYESINRVLKQLVKVRMDLSKVLKNAERGIISV